jgi:transposase
VFRQSFPAPPPRLRERLVALALVAEGLPAKVVAQRLGRHRGTVEHGVRGFKARGREGLVPEFRGQPGALLSAEELAQVHQGVQHAPRAVGLKTGTWTGTAVVALIKRTFGRTISAATARRYWHRQGCRRKRPRQRFTTADPEAQRAFAQGLQPREHRREPGRVTVGMDQGQSWQDALPRLGWLLRGQPAWVDATSPSTRAQWWCYVAVVRPLGRVLTRRCAWCTQATTAQFLAKSRRRLRGSRLELIDANAPPHQGVAGEQALALHRMEPHRLPPYSPPMNAAEPWMGWAKEVVAATTCW